VPEHDAVETAEAPLRVVGEFVGYNASSYSIPVNWIPTSNAFGIEQTSPRSFTWRRIFKTPIHVAASL
jgi:hypothetical protein